jgi:hypothetical protein
MSSVKAFFTCEALLWPCVYIRYRIHPFWKLPSLISSFEWGSKYSDCRRIGILSWLHLKEF